MAGGARRLSRTYLALGAGALLLAQGPKRRAGVGRCVRRSALPEEHEVTRPSSERHIRRA